MRIIKFLSILLLLVLGQSIIVACGSNDDEKNVQDETSPATIDYLCSTLMWVYAPDSGIKKGEEYETFFFGRIGDELICTITKCIGGSDDTSLKRFNFTYSPPTLTLKEKEDITGKIAYEGETRTLTVYKLTRLKYTNSSADWLQINGKTYMKSIGGGVNIK